MSAFADTRSSPRAITSCPDAFDAEHLPATLAEIANTVEGGEGLSQFDELSTVSLHGLLHLHA